MILNYGFGTMTATTYVRERIKYFKGYATDKLITN